MKLRHPYEWLSTSSQNRAFVILLVVTLVVMALLQVLGGPLKTDAAPLGIISFELAGKLSLAQSIVESWGAMAQVYAGLNLGLDYLFIVAYASSIGLGCVLVARGLAQRAGFLSSIGVILAWALLGAGLFDCVENYSLIQILLGSRQDSLPVIAQWCAVPKFVIVGVGLVYIVIGVIVILATKVGKRNENAT